MNFCKNPHYIYDNGNEVVFNSIPIPNEVINAFLYRLCLKDNRDELRKRLLDGKETLTTKLVDAKNNPISQDSATSVVASLFCESNEDVALRYIMQTDIEPSKVRIYS